MNQTMSLVVVSNRYQMDVYEYYVISGNQCHVFDRTRSKHSDWSVLTTAIKSPVFDMQNCIHLIEIE